MMRARSHRYPDDDADIYTDTTHFDPDIKCLDIGFQRLKIINLKSYPDFSIIKSLYIDHNNLTTLPDPKHIPNLTELNCSNNKLTSIPFYPNLIYLIMSTNRIKNISSYNGSSLLKYLDCSFNPEFELGISLPNCTNIYITDCSLSVLNLDSFPRIKILDCENNQLSNLANSSTIIELNVSNNLFSSIANYPNLARLYADHNKLSVVEQFNRLVLLSATHNKITLIRSQPKLEKLFGGYNQIIQLGSMPSLETIDMPHNQLNTYTLPPTVSHAYLYFNPLTDIKLQFTNILELQISFYTYRNIYQGYETKFKFANIHTSVEKLDQILTSMNRVFDLKLINKIKKKMTKIRFSERDVHLFKLALLLYWKLFSPGEIETIEELVQTKEFSRLLQILTDMYYKTMIVTLYFNGYPNY